jgi:SPP1 family predicted phage head-tail adaptor
MKIGDLNKQIELQYTTKVPDNMGGFVNTFVTSATVWATIWPTSANEMVAANATSMVVTHKIRIRFRTAIKPSWRIKYGDKFYSIVSIINPNMANRWLDIMAKEAA